VSASQIGDPGLTRSNSGEISQLNKTKNSISSSSDSSSCSSFVVVVVVVLSNNSLHTVDSMSVITYCYC